MVKKIILKTDIKREPGFLYFCGTDQKTGNLTIGRSEMARGRKAKKKTVAKKKVVKKKK